MRHVWSLMTVCLIVSALGSPLTAQDEKKPEAAPEKKEAAPAKIDRAKFEALFAEKLTGATLVGSFTISDAPANQLPKPDRYMLRSVSKVKDDYYLFVYNHQGIPIPLTLKVLWAGDTPVLVLDDLTIAGMGTFSARLMFHLQADMYAGTWQHGKKGGLMYGRIIPAPKKQVPAPTKKKEREPEAEAAADSDDK